LEKIDLEIRLAETPADLDKVRTLFREYESWLAIDLCFQGFEEELASLPGKYAAARGRLFVAAINGALAGCVALRPLTDDTAELKRLFVRESFRGLGAAGALMDRVIDAAREIGYRRIVLDTLYPRMATAVSLYRAYGFEEIPAYYNNPHEDALFMEKLLAQIFAP